MAMDTASLMGFAVLGSMKKAERKRAETSLMLTLMPGPPATRAAISTVAVGNQARDAVRREKRVAEATAVAVGQAIVGRATVEAAITAQPALRDLEPATLAIRVGQVVAPVLAAIAEAAEAAAAAAVETAAEAAAKAKEEAEAAAKAKAEAEAAQAPAAQAPAAQAPAAQAAPAAPVVDYAAALALAGSMVEKALAKTKARTFTAQEAAAFKAFVDLLDAPTQAKLIKN